MDYVLAEEFVKNYTEDCYVDENIDIESDHRIIITAMNTPRSKRARWKKQILNNSTRIDVRLLLIPRLEKLPR